MGVLMLLADKRYAPANLGRVLILGYGVSGRACEQYLLPLVGSRVEALTVLHDDKETNDALLGCEQTFDLCIASPGISMFSEMYQLAKQHSTEVISEVEFAWRESNTDSKWVAITGTNGKTTTTALTEFILKDAGINARAVGNIGDACIAAVGAGKSKVFVTEVSSFQLASIDMFTPDVAVVLGITPDHIEWHKTHEHYVQSKFKMLDNMLDAGSGVAVLDATNDEVRSKIKSIRHLSDNYIPIGSSDGVESDMRAKCGSTNAAFVDARGQLQVAFYGREHLFVSIGDMQLQGRHNWINALAASSVAVVLGVSDSQIEESLSTFKALPHRIEPVGFVHGCQFFNDSKATNVDSTLCALTSFPGKRVAVLLGGHDKMGPLDELASTCATNASAVVCFGEAKDRFYEAICPIQTHEISVLKAQGLKDAFELVVNKLFSSEDSFDVVLLSPACSSYDEFNNYQERGDYFRNLVASLSDSNNCNM